MDCVVLTSWSEVLRLYQRSGETLTQCVCVCVCVCVYVCAFMHVVPSWSGMTVFLSAPQLARVLEAGYTRGSHDGSGLSQQLTRLVMIADAELNIQFQL